MPYHLYAYDSYGTTTEGGGYYGDQLASYKGYDKGPFGYKTGVRQYDPETGRFLSPDPFKGYMTDPASQHPYMYCRGNPISYADPSGYDDVLILYGVDRQHYSKSAVDSMKSGGNKVDEKPLESLDQIKEALTKYDYIILACHGKIERGKYLGIWPIKGDYYIGSKDLANLLLNTSNIRTKLVIVEACLSGNIERGMGLRETQSLKHVSYVGTSNYGYDYSKSVYPPPLLIVSSLIDNPNVGLKYVLKSFPPFQHSQYPIKWKAYPAATSPALPYE